MLPKGLAKERDCTGCGACYAACPRKGLTMEPNSEGFLAPHETERCTDCGACAKVCPIAHPPVFHEQAQWAAAAWCRSDSDRMGSSSGGFFRVLARSVLERGGLVFGAAFDDAFFLRHKSADSEEGCRGFYGSKYLQSDTALTFRETKDALGQNRPVLYAGTPCQIAGLYSFLGGDHNALVTCELVCNGVPSPEVFAGYRELLEQKHKAKITDIRFRAKRANTHKTFFTIRYSNGKTTAKPLCDTPYGHGFGAMLFLRPVCGHCFYAQPRRCADFTLGDFWGLGDETPFPYDKTAGVSLVLRNSEKAKSLPLPDMFCETQRPFSEAVGGNSRLAYSLTHNPRREGFFADRKTMPFEALMKKYCAIPPAPLRFVLKLMSPEVKSKIKKLLKR